MRKRFFLFAFIFFITQIILFSQDEKKLDVSKNLVTGTLDNGLEYFIFKNKKPENRASLNLVVKAGSLMESEEQQGLAHFLEHMAFNGTTKYEKNELIRYLQSLGLSFGGDLNAYTSFSETVYKLQVPTTKKDLETGFDVLKEWASEVTLAPNEIENEKNIIIEEWRLRQGITQRVGDLQKQILFGDSWYSKRFPIGFPETIKGADVKKLKDYYDRWYQPSNMAVVAVGDFDIENIENLIKINFSSLKDNFKENIEVHNIPLSVKNSVTIFTDPELTTTNFNIMWKENIEAINDISSFKTYISKILLNSILNTRFSILSKESDSPFIYSSIYNFPLNHSTGIYAISALVKDNNIEKTIQATVENFKNISLNGVLESELQNEKTNLINNLQTILNNKESITNDSYISSIVDYILKDNTFIEIDDEIKLTNLILDEINIDTIKSLATDILNLKYDVLLTSRENMKDVLPKENELETFINKIISSTSINLTFENLNPHLLPLDLASGEITSTLQKNDFEELTLSNGIKVLYKNTDFDKDKINFKLTKLEGSSRLDNTNYINSMFLTDVLNNSGVGEIDYKSIEVYFKGKNFSVSPYIGDYTQGFNISSNKQDLIEALNYFRTLVKNPRIDETIITSILQKNEEIIKNRDLSPRALFRKEFLQTLNSNHSRRVPLELNELNLISKQNLENVFEELFSNFNGYTLTVTGSIEKPLLEEILKKYFANLPVNETLNSFKPLEINYPKGSVRKTVVKGIDKKATVLLAFPYKGDFSIENRVLYNGISSLLNILLIEDVREKIGGVYSISSFANLDKLNFGEDYLQISFNTDVNRVEEVIKQVKLVIDNIQNGNFPKNKISDIQKNYELNFETSIKTNSFWNTYLEKKNLISDYHFYTPIMYNEVINYNSIVDFSKKAIDSNNYVEVLLLPEREE